MQYCFAKHQFMNKYIQWYESLKIHPVSPLEIAAQVFYFYTKALVRKDWSKLTQNGERHFDLIKMSFLSSAIDNEDVKGLYLWQKEIKGLCEVTAKEMVKNKEIESEDLCYRVLCEPLNNGKYDPERLPKIIETIGNTIMQQITMIQMN